MKRTILLLLLLLPLSALHSQWARGEDELYANLSFTYLRYHEVIDDFTLREGFKKHSIERSVSDHTMNAYLEYGVSDRFTAVANIPYKFLSTGNELLEAPDDRYTEDTVSSGSLNALGNVRLGGRYSFHRGKYHWAAKFMGGMKSASYLHEPGLRSGYDAWTAVPELELGRGWEKSYFSVSLGYRFKSNGYANDLISRNEFGYKWSRGPDKATWFIFTMGALLPVTEGDYDDRNSVHTALYQDEEGFVDPGLKVNHSIDEHWSINLSSIGAIWARHGGDELTYTLGISYES